MKKKAARALAGVLTLSMAAALTACGGSDSAKKGGETAAAAESSGPITGQTLSLCFEGAGEQDALGNVLNHWRRKAKHDQKDHYFP